MADQQKLRISCPACQAVLRARPEYVGRKARCKSCGHQFVVEPPAAGEDPVDAMLAEFISTPVEQNERPTADTCVRCLRTVSTLSASDQAKLIRNAYQSFDLQSLEAGPAIDPRLLLMKQVCRKCQIVLCRECAGPELQCPTCGGNVIDPATADESDVERGRVLGRWKVDSWDSRIITMFRLDGQLRFEQEFDDGSIEKKTLCESESPEFDYVEENNGSNQYRLDRDGTLRHLLDGTEIWVAEKLRD
ncbi:hypothetical protein Mal4_00570 [Maioricimonas rarisocia]|uniref:Uncharacterized protein n=1 Tax=Maioricimonas rarisocia TaxID=2528026 RepID=A0A517YZY0_9PLAN|nr:hypothetical protein [Maioricimonas rarisocia]QDU35775.1 hypothetical protein Mal4_00570 [Maioricimonas rarisocia]